MTCSLCLNAFPETEAVIGGDDVEEGDDDDDDGDDNVVVVASLTILLQASTSASGISCCSILDPSPSFTRSPVMIGSMVDLS